MNFLLIVGLDSSTISCGHRFMSDLLVWSLMADGGLETALYEALKTEMAEIADAEETFEISTVHTTIPLLHLVKQLLKYCIFFKFNFRFMNIVLGIVVL